jgi:hypothetical protein
MACSLSLIRTFLSHSLSHSNIHYQKNNKENKNDIYQYINS